MKKLIILISLLFTLGLYSQTYNFKCDYLAYTKDNQLANSMYGEFNIELDLDNNYTYFMWEGMNHKYTVKDFQKYENDEYIYFLLENPNNKNNTLIMAININYKKIIIFLNKTDHFLLTFDKYYKK